MYMTIVHTSRLLIEEGLLQNLAIIIGFTYIYSSYNVRTFLYVYSSRYYKAALNFTQYTCTYSPLSWQSWWRGWGCPPGCSYTWYHAPGFTIQMFLDPSMYNWGQYSSIWEEEEGTSISIIILSFYCSFSIARRHAVTETWHLTMRTHWLHKINGQLPLL